MLHSHLWLKAKFGISSPLLLSQFIWESKYKIFCIINSIWSHSFFFATCLRHSQSVNKVTSKNVTKSTYQLIIIYRNCSFAFTLHIKLCDLIQMFSRWTRFLFVFRWIFAVILVLQVYCAANIVFCTMQNKKENKPFT